jgi:hypothetical protein
MEGYFGGGTAREVAEGAAGGAEFGKVLAGVNDDQRELEESEGARMASETERNELLEKEGVLVGEVMRLTEALESLRDRLEFS